MAEYDECFLIYDMDSDVPFYGFDEVEFKTKNARQEKRTELELNGYLSKCFRKYRTVWPYHGVRDCPLFFIYGAVIPSEKKTSRSLCRRAGGRAGRRRRPASIYNVIRGEVRHQCFRLDMRELNN
ncbi:hypothetical protein DPMN_177967 [Dreissena polymorpha]|uniref:Uncharacterized protein n=1 Tax=Dreissena polymorpha TaxID=45954 RepID=A0A9D4IKQ0_DREPO|nr:hypothetical protein DPMN_177967 [Dreissena polymorpha]